METITAELIVELYAKYQLLNYWYHFGITFAVIFGIIGFFITIFASFESEPLPLIIGAIFLALFVAGVIIALRFNYKINVEFKPEVAKYVVPAGLDVAEKIGKEISDMWDILKGVITN
jgi:hypothetical protein